MAAGKAVEEVCKGLGVIPDASHRRQEEHGGADVDTVRQNEALKEENPALKRRVVNQALKSALQVHVDG